MTRDTDRDSTPDPEHACARDWQPVEAPERRPEPKREDESVLWSPSSTDAPEPDPDPALRTHDAQESDQADRPDRGDVEPDVGGRHG